MFDFVAFDVETTGMDVERDEIVEIAAVRFLDGSPTEVFETLIDPGRGIPIQASRVHGITDDMVTSKPTVSETLRPFAAFCGDLPLVAHNAPFDVQFIAWAVEKHRTEAPTGMVLDSCAMARQVCPGLFSYKLDSLIKHFKIPHSAFHRAAADASYCGLVFIKLVEVLSGSGKIPDMARLAALSGAELRFPVVEVAEQLRLF